jgi:hypothetical protein
MKAPIAQAGEEAASSPGCDFLVFIWGLELEKIFFKKLGFRLGPDISVVITGRI